MRLVRYGSGRSQVQAEIDVDVLVHCRLRSRKRPSIQGTHMLVRASGAISGTHVPRYPKVTEETKGIFEEIRYIFHSQ